MKQDYESISWQEDHLVIIDQTQLPLREIYTDIFTIGQVWEAIKKLKIQGASAIAIAGAYGLYLGVHDLESKSFTSFNVELNRWIEYLKSARPTTATLNWALERVNSTVYANKEKSLDEIKDIILQTAKTIHDEDKRFCRLIGEKGEAIIPKKANILTLGNAGGLSASVYGTALSAIFQAQDAKKNVHVWVSETRPNLQGARLSCWELKKAEIPHHLITDASAGHLMATGKVDMVITGAETVTANGDTINKTGTYPLAVIAKENDIPFYVALTCSTFNLEAENGQEIEIEEGDEEEVTHISKTPIPPKKTEAYNPTVDITPHKYISGFITDKGVIEPDFKENIRKLLD